MKTLTTHPRSNLAEFFAKYGNRETRESDFGFTGFNAETKDNTLEIRIYDIIDSSDFWGGVTPSAVAKALRESRAKNIVVRINSPGGDAFAGIAIYNLLKDERRDVEVIIDGLAASAASVAAMGGKRITMNPGSMMMIHQAWAFVAGNSDGLRAEARVLDSVDDSLVAVYAKFSGRDSAEIKALMVAETWFSADAAIEAGFASSENRDTVRAQADLTQSKNFAVNFNNLFTAERGLQNTIHTGETNMSDMKAYAALEVKNEALTNELSGLKTERSQLQATVSKHEAAIKALSDEAAVQRASYDALAKKHAEASVKAIDAEVTALVGVKITPAEHSTFVALASTNRDLFDQMVSNRPALALAERLIKPEGDVLAAAHNGPPKDFAEVLEES